VSQSQEIDRLIETWRFPTLDRIFGWSQSQEIDRLIETYGTVRQPVWPHRRSQSQEIDRLIETRHDGVCL